MRLIATCLALTLVPLSLSGCDRDDLYSDATFSENVSAAYAECNEAEISFLATKHNLQLAFGECGSNKFIAKSWSPDGQLLAFQLTHGASLLDVETMNIETIPTEAPVSGSAWVRQGLLAIPLPSKAEGQPFRIAWYDREQRTLVESALPGGYADPMDLQSAGEGELLALTLVGQDGVRRPYVYDRNTSTVERLLPGVDRPFERFSYVSKADLASWSDGKDSELLRISTGETLRALPGVKRAIPHHEGRYVALEVDGAPISLFDQRTWNELSPEAREREQRRKDEWLKGLPDWAPREAQPPEIHILDLETNQRYRVTSFFGDHFEWYQPRNYWLSFMLWGIEGKQLHRNVAVTDIAERLRMLAKGETPIGMEPVNLDGSPSTAAAAPTAPEEDKGVSPERQPPDPVSTQTGN